MTRFTKKDIGKYVNIIWRDPQTEIRIKLDTFMNNPYGIIETKGEVRVVKQDIIVLSSEICKADGEEDLTSIHPALIIAIKVIGRKE